MKDDDLEALLRGYLPVGPPRELRARIIAAAAVPRRAPFVREWAPVAAALMLTILFYWLSANQQEIIASHFAPVPPIDRASVTMAPPAEDFDR